MISIPKEFKQIEYKLKEPFPESDIKWRVQRQISDSPPTYVILAYVDARAVQNRLDQVFGIFGWEILKPEVTQDGILLGIRVNYGGIVKEVWDGSPETKIEAFKGGISKAFVRAASTGLGVGRYLYNLPATKVVAIPSEQITDKSRATYVKSGNQWYAWVPPKVSEILKHDRIQDLKKLAESCNVALEELKDYSEKKYQAVPSKLLVEDPAKFENLVSDVKNAKVLPYLASLHLSRGSDEKVFKLE